MKDATEILEANDLLRGWAARAAELDALPATIADDEIAYKLICGRVIVTKGRLMSVCTLGERMDGTIGLCVDGDVRLTDANRSIAITMLNA